MKRLLYCEIVFVLLFLPTGLLGKCGNGKIYIMPKELVEVAEKNGYTQVDEFYCNKPGKLNPCYVYGYRYSANPIDAEKSAVFWARKIEENSNTIFLLFVSRSAGYLPFSLDEAIETTGSPRGLSIVRDTSITLDNFRFLKGYEKGPADVKAKGNIVKERYDGVGSDYYYYNGEWLIRGWD